ncbi:hypothetical protein OG559_14315 [Micromonospora sp. NBC_01405]|uniref:Rv0361 family membrane protein n=1 Tax=Micromonospora sp. NBC_01405 TaxID=2903589 RepID=UPI00324AE754
MTYPPTPGFPGPPQKSRGLSRTTRTVIIVVAVVALLCCAGAVGGGLWLFRTVQGTITPARDAATAYLDDTKAGNYPAAYARLCERLRSRQTEAQFTRARQAEPPLDEYRVTDTQVHTSNGDTSAEVTVKIADRNRVISLVKEGDQWRVCGG